MKTRTPSKDQQVKKQWFLIDAEGKVLGRVAAKVAAVLRGKHKAQFAPHVDMGDHIVVLNVSKMVVTGKKMEDKNYYTHSGYPGGLKTAPLKRMMDRKPLEAFRLAVRGMIPRNTLRDKVLKKLHLFAGAEHQHEAQKPQPLDV